MPKTKRRKTTRRKTADVIPGPWARRSAPETEEAIDAFLQLRAELAGAHDRIARTANALEVLGGLHPGVGGRPAVPDECERLRCELWTAMDIMRWVLWQLNPFDGDDAGDAGDADDRNPA